MTLVFRSILVSAASAGLTAGSSASGAVTAVAVVVVDVVVTVVAVAPVPGVVALLTSSSGDLLPDSLLELV